MSLKFTRTEGACLSSYNCLHSQEDGTNIFPSELYNMLPVNGLRGKTGEEEKKESVGMAKDFDFQISAICAMFRLTFQVFSMTTTNFAYIAQLRSWASIIFPKIRKSVSW